MVSRDDVILGGILANLNSIFNRGRSGPRYFMWNLDLFSFTSHRSEAYHLMQKSSLSILYFILLIQNHIILYDTVTYNDLTFDVII